MSVVSEPPALWPSVTAAQADRDTKGSPQIISSCQEGTCGRRAELGGLPQPVPHPTFIPVSSPERYFGPPHSFKAVDHLLGGGMSQEEG